MRCYRRRPAKRRLQPRHERSTCQRPLHPNGQRHVPSALVKALKIPECDLMTRPQSSLGSPPIGAIHNPSRRPMDRDFHPTFTVRRETAYGNRPGFAAGIQGEDGSSATPCRPTIPGHALHFARTAVFPACPWSVGNRTPGQWPCRPTRVIIRWWQDRYAATYGSPRPIYYSGNGRLNSSPAPPRLKPISARSGSCPPFDLRRTSNLQSILNTRWPTWFL